MKISKLKLKNKTNKLITIFIIAVIGVFLFRAAKLDIDLPNWGMTNYQPIDEGQYAMMAISNLEYGTWHPDTVVTDVSVLTPAHMRNNVIGNIINYAGLITLGDNYYGLRSSSVLIGLVNFLIFILILFELKKKYGLDSKKELLFIFGLSIYTVSEFTFLVASRVVEPSTLRMLFIQLVIYIFLKLKDESHFKYPLVGFLSVLSVFAVYITNIFLVLSIGVVILLKLFKKDKSDFFHSFFGFGSGSAIAFLVCDFYYYAIWKSSALLNTFNIIQSFSEVAKYQLKVNFLYSFRFFFTNYNLYNVIIFVIFMLCLPLIVVKAFQAKDQFLSLLIFIYVGFYLQTFIVNDYIQRKFIILFPLVLFIIFITWLTSEKTDYQPLLKKPWIKFGYLFYTLGICAFACFSIIYRLFMVNDVTFMDFQRIDKIVLLAQIPLLIIMMVSVAYHIHKKVNIRTGLFKTILVGVFCTLCLNVYFDTKYVWLNNSYTEKAVMIELGKEADDLYVFGEFSIGFTLYNSIKPVVNSAQQVEIMLSNKIPSYYLDFNLAEFKFRKYTLNKAFIYERNFSTFGVKKEIILYQTKKN